MSDSEHSSDDECYEGPVRPYLFEPMAKPVAESSIESMSAGSSAHVIDVSDLTTWCTCLNCVVMDTAAECVCCQSITVIKAKCQEVADSGQGPAPTCIVQHPGFRSVCLDVWVLQAVYNEYKQRYGHVDKPLFDRYRYCAYRHLVRWCWGYIGKQHRVLLPACAVTAIRQRFPAEEYTGFRVTDHVSA